MPLCLLCFCLLSVAIVVQALGADDVIREEACNHSEEARFGKVAWEGRQVIIAGPNKQARLKAGKRALGLLQTHSTDEDLAAFLHLSEEPAPRHCLSSQSASANAWGSQCLPGAASASSSLGQPVPAQPVPGAARACLGQPALAWGSHCLLRDNKVHLCKA